LVEPEQPNTAANFEDLMARMTQAINQNQTQTPAVMQDITTTKLVSNLMVPIMLYGPKLLSCSSQEKTSWDI
jgi:hypothetical protein